MTRVQMTALEDAAFFNEGAGMDFTMETTAGTHRLSIPTPDLGKILAFFATAATEIGAELEDAGRPSWPPVNETVPIPIDHIDFQPGQTRDSSLIVLSVGGFGLAFELPSEELRRLGPKLAELGAMMSAKGDLQ